MKSPSISGPQTGRIFARRQRAYCQEACETRNDSLRAHRTARPRSNEGYKRSCGERTSERLGTHRSERAAFQNHMFSERSNLRASALRNQRFPDDPPDRFLVQHGFAQREISCRCHLLATMGSHIRVKPVSWKWITSRLSVIQGNCEERQAAGPNGAHSTRKQLSLD